MVTSLNHKLLNWIVYSTPGRTFLSMCLLQRVSGKLFALHLATFKTNMFFFFFFQVTTKPLADDLMSKMCLLLVKENKGYHQLLTVMCGRRFSQDFLLCSVVSPLLSVCFLCGFSFRTECTCRETERKSQFGTNSKVCT